MQRPLIELVISGWISSKKNCLRLSRSGHGYYDKDVRENIDGIMTQLAAQWRKNGVPMAPMAHPGIAIVFYLTTSRSDRDNLLTTVQDAMVDAGILKDDNVANHNSPMIIGQAIVTDDGVAGARIWLDEAGNTSRLLRHMSKLDLDDYSVITDQRSKTNNARFKKA